MPLCYLAFVAHLYKHSYRRVLDIVVSGIQFCGTVMYYAPCVADGGKFVLNGEPVLFVAGIVAGGLVWLVVPALVVWRHVRVEGEMWEGGWGAAGKKRGTRGRSGRR